MPRYLLIFLLLFACAPPKPVLLFQSNILGDGGVLIRDLYRSGWYPPGSDDDLIRVGLIPGRPSVRFRAPHKMKIRALAEHASWEVASPAGVTWVVESRGTLRPPLLSHFPVVETRTVRRGKRPPETSAALWRDRGYPAARWVGPPPMDTSLPSAALERWILALSASLSAEKAADLCGAARRQFKSACRVQSRVELPALGRGRVVALKSNFSKDFEGVLELLSPDGPVEILEIVPEGLTGEKSKELYGPRLFIVPRLNGSLSVVQQTSFGNYLEGVVPAEIFPSAPENALKAQSVVARTYAARFSAPAFPEQPYFICASTDCQVYRGVAHKRPATARAVENTKDLVLVDSGKKLAETFYHSICGGHTEPRTSVFGGPRTSYLSGVPDDPSGEIRSRPPTDADVAADLDRPATAYCGTAGLINKDRWRWSRSFDVPALSRLVTATGLSGRLKDVRVLRRGLSGRVLDLELVTETGRKKISGELRIRQFLGGFWSSMFVLEAEKDGDFLASLTVRGGGYGHGVGLCQMGAIGRAERGQTFQEILNAYYPGTSVDPLTNLMIE